jgi:hypothetical protein
MRPWLWLNGRALVSFGAFAMSIRLTTHSTGAERSGAAQSTRSPRGAISRLVTVAGGR